MQEKKITTFIQKNSPNGGFLQSWQWSKFQKATGRKTFIISQDNFYASIIEHQLPIVGKYFYIPRGPLASQDEEFSIFNFQFSKIIELAKKENVGWIRIDADYKNIHHKTIKAPHDMQPREVFLIDIEKSEDELLAEMKPKTRYNIKLAERKGVRIFMTREKKHTERFCELVQITARRDRITSHPAKYYQQMLEMIPEENLKLYIAEFEGKIIAANLTVFYGDTATYLHGASDNENRNAMAPFLLQWRQIQDAKKAGCTKYDFGGVQSIGDNSWAGITKFKTGFSPKTKPFEFSGSYDIVIDPMKYDAYRILHKIKSFL